MTPIQKINLAIFILNVIGTFCLSIEAMKIDNFEKIIYFIRHSNRIINPKIKWVDETKKKTESLSYRIDFFVFLILFGTPAYLILSHFLKSLQLLYKIPLSFIGGFFVWGIVVILNELVLKFLKLLIRNTTKGIIGILGFILLAISFYLQFKLTQSA